jgi:hypothetical protein
MHQSTWLPFTWSTEHPADEVSDGPVGQSISHLVTSVMGGPGDPIIGRRGAQHINRLAT